MFKRSFRLDLEDRSRLFHQRCVTWLLKRLKSLAYRLLVQQLFLANNKWSINARYYWPVVSRTPVNFPHKETIMRKAFPCHDVTCTEFPAACQTAVDWMLSWNLTNRPSVSFEGMHPVTHGDAHVQIIRNTHMLSITHNVLLHYYNRADSRFAPSQWEMSLQSNAVSHWLCANLESALLQYIPIIILLLVCCCDLVPADFSYVL